MKKIFKRIAALVLVALVGVSSVACSLDGLEQPEWLEQALCDHVFDEEEILKEPTCVKNGKKEKICSVCGKTKITTIRATGEHVYDDGVQENGILTSTASWNERVTAGGANVIDGSQAKLHKVVGNSVVQDGMIVHASFGGIKSTNANGEESVLAFPATELPSGAEIDFDNKKIVDNYVTLELTGEESWTIYSGAESSVLLNPFLPTVECFAKGWSTDGIVQIGAVYDYNSIWIGAGNGNQALYWIGVLQEFGTVDNFKSWIKQRKAEGNPVTIRYIPSTEYKTETPFTDEMKAVENEYTVWKGGTETALGNDVPVSEISTSYVCGCTVCGQLKVDEETCNHEILTGNGNCFVCGFDFSALPTTAVNVGDAFFGWYHGFSFEDTEVLTSYQVALEILVEIEGVAMSFECYFLDTSPKVLSFDVLGAISYSFALDCKVSGEYFYVPEKTAVDVLCYDDSTGESRYIEDVEIKGVIVKDIQVENSLYLKRPLEKVIL